MGWLRWDWRRVWGAVTEGGKRVQLIAAGAGCTLPSTTTPQYPSQCRSGAARRKRTRRLRPDAGQPAGQPSAAPAAGQRAVNAAPSLPRATGGDCEFTLLWLLDRDAACRAHRRLSKAAVAVGDKNAGQCRSACVHAASSVATNIGSIQASWPLIRRSALSIPSHRRSLEAPSQSESTPQRTQDPKLPAPVGRERLFEASHLTHADSVFCLSTALPSCSPPGSHCSACSESRLRCQRSLLQAASALLLVLARQLTRQHRRTPVFFG